MLKTKGDNMKIQDASYNDLKDAIGGVIARFGLDKIQRHRDNIDYVKSQFISFCWSVLHASHYDCNILYKQGLDDSHIETAIKHILIEYK